MLTLDYDTAQRITDYPHPNVTLYRYSTDYLDEPKPKTLFSPSDAISLAMLSRSNMDHPRLPDDHLDFYDRAYVAVCRGLELANYVAFHAAIVMWTRGEAPMESALIDEQWFQQIKLSLNEQVRLWQLIQIRARLIHFQNEWGDVLEGNIWGERETHSPGRTARMEARNWYRKTADAALGGFMPLDFAICSEWGWKFETMADFETLRAEFGYPDSKEISPWT